MMINISINNENISVTCEVLEQLLHQREIQSPFAVAINGEFVPNTHYGQTILNSGDTVDIVSPIFGG